MNTFLPAGHRITSYNVCYTKLLRSGPTIGGRTPVWTASAALIRPAMPAAVFGAIYWLRGLGTAVLAHVAAYVALAAIVL